MKHSFAQLGLLLVTLLFLVSFCYSQEKSVEVNGVVECTDCTQSSNALSGHRVAISCIRAEDKSLEMRGIGEIKGGTFKVTLPNDIVDDNGHLKEECSAEFLTASCPSSEEDMEASKIIFKSKENGKNILGLRGKLKFSPTACKSAADVNELVSENSEVPEDLTEDEKFYFLHHKKYFHKHPYHKYYKHPYHKYYKPIPKIPYHKYYKPIPKVPHHPDPFHKYHPHEPEIPDGNKLN